MPVQKYGGKRAALRFATYALLARLGLCSASRQVQWRRAKRLVFVCSGNICRSPFAAELAKKRGLPAASFGVDARGNAAAEPRAAAAALRWDVDLGSHVSTSLEQFRPLDGDVFVAMEPRHLKIALPLAAKAGAQSTLLGMWCTAPRPYLPDPYGASVECFYFVFHMIDDALANIGNSIGGQE